MSPDRAREAASARPSPVVSAGLLLAGAALLAAYHWLHGRWGLGLSFVEQGLHFRPSPGELFSLLLALATVVPATFLLGEALRRGAPGLPRRLLALGAAEPGKVVALLALLGVAVALLARHLVVLDADLTDDERTYWYQAQVFLESGFTGPLPRPLRAFLPAFAIPIEGGEGLAGLFPVGQPLLMAAASLLGDPSLFQALFVGGIVLLTWRLALRLLEEPRLALLAAALVALSPWLLGVAATKHNAVPSTFFVLLSLWMALEARERPALWRALLTGLAIGISYLVRPLDGLVVGVTVAAVWIAAFRALGGGERLAFALRTLAALGATGAAASVQLLANLRTTGSLLETAYPRWVAQGMPGAPLFGFGKTIWNLEQTPLSALTKTLTALLRIELWASGWPLLLVVVAIGLAHRPFRRRGWPLWLFSGLLFLGYFLYIFPSVQDLGTLYHLPAWPALALAVAVGLERLAARFGRERVAAHALAATLCALATFWVVQAVRLHGLAGDITRPVALAEEAAAAAPGGKILLLWSDVRGGRRSWVTRPPLPSPRMDEPVLWVRDRPELHAELAARYPERLPLRLVWKARGQPALVPVALGAGPP
ncbi:MAG: glycosyltransferase family 39 protein [Deltaproteobacteria bacterium]|nr:glycosyltransferase family 39 protein [Deltaproteobacteria bacterium]